MARLRAARKFVLVAITLAVVIASPILADNKEKNPLEIGNRRVSGRLNLYSVPQEISMGKQLAIEVDRQVRYVADPAVTGYLDRIGQNLARNSDVGFPVEFRVVESDDVTAFTLPGGHIYITSGFIRLTSSEAELASALAHELGHAAARHATREATRVRLLNIGTVPLMLFGGWGGVAAGGAARVILPMAFLKFSRSFETEADLLGLEYLWKAGYDPEASVDLFETLESTERRRPGSVSKLFKAHPRTPDRIVKTQENIDKFLPARREYILNTAEYEEIRAKL